jgi:Tol biopolymer transport system component
MTSRLVISQFFGFGAELDEVGLADGSLRRIDLRQNPTWPAISPKGDKLAFSTSSGRASILRKDLRRPEAPSTELATSTQDQGDAQYSPDGKHIAFRSSRTGSPEIWMADAEWRQFGPTVQRKWRCLHSALVARRQKNRV